MITKYFQSLNFYLSHGTTGLYAVNFGKHDEWYCCAYRDKDMYKRNIVHLTNEISGLNTTEYDWDFHHIIEQQHLADIPLKELGLKTLAEYYANEIPTVIISKAEHQLLSSYLHFKEFRKLYYVNQRFTTPSGAGARQNIANQNFAKGTITKTDVNKIINGLIEMYDNVYIRHIVFKTISRNFLNDIRSQIR